MKRIVSTLIAAVLYAGAAAAGSDLEARVAALEKEVAELKAALLPVIEEARKDEVVNRHRNAARQRMRKDAEIYSREELQEIESLYQLANKQWNSQEGKDSLKTLTGKYTKANRTGCALLYLGQMSEGSEREGYLKQAIEGFSDCYYGDGVQVGAYARYYLAYHYKDTGNKKESEKLFSEIREQYPDAIDHKGNLLSRRMEH